MIFDTQGILLIWQNSINVNRYYKQLSKRKQRNETQIFMHIQLQHQRTNLEDKCVFI